MEFERCVCCFVSPCEDVSSLRCAARNNNNPDNRNNNRGFRVVRPQSFPAGLAGAPAKPGPGAGVLRNIGLVFGYDMICGPFSGVRPRGLLRGKPEYKLERAALVSDSPVITGTPNQQPDIFKFDIDFLVTPVMQPCKNENLQKTV